MPTTLPERKRQTFTDRLDHPDFEGWEESVRASHPWGVVLCLVLGCNPMGKCFKKVTFRTVDDAFAFIDEFELSEDAGGLGFRFERPPWWMEIYHMFTSWR